MKLNIALTEFVNKIQSEGKDVYRFCVSDERINRNGWKILTAGIDFKDYLDNPVVLLGHWGDIPIGKAINVFSEAEKLFADIWFHAENEESALVKKLVELGVLSMTSIGIRVLKRGTPIPISPEDRDKYPIWQDTIEVFTQSELREISIVPIPANPGAKYQEKLNNAINQKLFTTNELERLSGLLTTIPGLDNTTDEINKKFFTPNNLKELDMTLEEAIRENGVLKTEKAALEKRLETANSKINDLEKEGFDKDTKTAALQKENDSLASELEAAKTAIQQNQLKIAEAQVEADIAGLSDKILPAENNEENKYKLKRDLLHLKINETSLIDADGKSLYSVKIAELKDRKSLSNLKQEIPAIQKPINNDITDYDINNTEHRKVLAEKAKELAAKNGTTFEVELAKLIGE